MNDEIIKFIDDLTLNKLENDLGRRQLKLKEKCKISNILIDSLYNQLLKTNIVELKFQKIDYEKDKQKIEILLEDTIDKIAQKHLKISLKLLDEIYFQKISNILIKV